MIFSESDIKTMMGGSEGILVNNIITIMHEFHFDLDTMRKMPIPTFLAILKKLNDDQKEMELSLKK